METVEQPASSGPSTGAREKDFFNIALLFVMIFLPPLLLEACQSNPLQLILLLLFVQCLGTLASLIYFGWNYLAFILISHIGTYTLSKVLLVYSHGNDLVPASILELEEIVRCTFLIIMAYFVSRVFIRTGRDAVVFKPIYLTTGNGLIFAFAMLAISLGTQSIPDGIIRPVLAVHLLLTVAIFCGETPQKPLIASLLKLFVLATTTLSFISLGFLGPALVLAQVVMMASISLKKYRVLVLGIPLVIFGILVQPVKGIYRAYSWNTTLSFAEKARVFKHLMGIVYLGSELDENIIDLEFFESNVQVANDAAAALNLEEGEGVEAAQLNKGTLDLDAILSASSTRVGDESLAKVLEMTPKTVPYWGGSTYANLFYIFIPRFLFPDKPGFDIGGKFGTVYGYLNDDDNFTSIAVSFLAEGYMNFGYVGLYLVAILFGIFARATEKVAVHILPRDLTVLAYVLLSVPLAQYNDPAVSIVSTVIINIITLGLLRKFLVPLFHRDNY